MNTLKEILKDHIAYKDQIFKLAKSDIIKTYKGTAFGWLWALIRPATQIFVYWFAFAVGLRHGRPMGEYPYFLWLLAGIIPWFYIKEILNTGTFCFRKYSYLVTKIKFPVAIIPTFISLAHIFVHIVLVLITGALFIAFGFKPDIYWLQIPFYMFLMFMFFNAWALFGGMLSAISKDFLNLVRTITTALFWLSGIFYEPSSISQGWIRTILSFNPVTMITHGYRDCFIYKQWFWENPIAIEHFAICFVVMCVLAIWSYKRLRKEISDVL